MKNEKASRAMGYIDEELVLSAMNESDIAGESAQVNAERKKKMKKNNLWKKLVAVAAAFVIMLTVGIFAAQMTVSASGATVALDVNPSIEIEINKNEKITKITALNEEAVIVIGDMDFIGVDLELGMNAIIGSMLNNDYLSTEKNSILVSINSRSGSKSTALKEKISNDINTLLKNKNIDASVITQNFKDSNETSKLAEQNNISMAKASLIAKIVKSGLLDANGVPYTAETLAALNVNDLKLILESKALTVDGINTSGTASGKEYITKDAALAIALEQAGLSADNITNTEIEIDFEDDIRVRALVYEVEFVSAGMKYEYELLASNGDVLEAKIKPNNERDDDNITAPDGAISREEALEIAYADAGVSAENVRRPEIELDKEGKLYVYEIEFKSGTREYEYTINAMTGKIIERESERD